MRVTFSHQVATVFFLISSAVANAAADPAPAPADATPWTMTLPGLVTFVVLFIILKIAIRSFFRGRREKKK